DHRCRKRGGIVGPLALGRAPGACSRERKRSSPSCEPLANTRFYRHDRRRAVRLACRHWLTERADCGASRSTLAAALAAVKSGHLAAGSLRRRAEPCPQLELGRSPAIQASAQARETIAIPVLGGLHHVCQRAARMMRI